MASRASSKIPLPGTPAQVDLAYLAGLLDRAGGFTAARPNAVGIKITAGEELRMWLYMRFGGYTTARGWWLQRQAALRYLLPRLRPFLVARGGECDAMIMLLTHLEGRPSYHSTPDWRADREQLMAAVRDVQTRRQRPRPRPGGSSSAPPGA